ncbi:uncharacterized protein LOC129737580 [Uranotaenia lowii]|uniref:uncharacterized protein LOC129737580 n=1 Tax=Uranotaenia lowii TaxID=190385 RepID=UPI00247AA5BD|nr:uncharacterized protein LOC129737580 [Uranotaenia lowii]
MREVSLMRMKEDEMERKLLKHELKRIQREREELEQQHVQERLVEGSILDGDDFEEDDFREKVDSWQVGDPVEMQQKQGSTVPNAERHKSADWKNSTLRNGESDSTSVDSFVEGYECSSKVHTSPNPTRSQIASRQVYPKTLPKFSGRPQDWPTFISAYEQANRSCGFNHAENLVRLQEALEGRAKDLVRNRLLLPENVPSIIEKLRKRFGNPEVLSTMLTDRVLQLVGPDSENLESVIEFGSAIEEFTQHLKASNLTDHLKNPNLMHRLVNKLPSCYAMQWVEFKRTKRSITLETFGEFMEELVDKALEATFEKVAMEESSKSKRRTAVKGYVHATDAEIQTSSCNCNKNEEFSRQSDAVQSFQSSRTERICSVCKNPGHYGRNCNQLKNQNVEDRWRTVQRLQLCPLCIYDHGNKECSSRRKCGFNQCNKRHHAVLHWEENPGPSYVTASCNNQKQCDQSVLFRMIPITLYNKSIKVDTLALIDEGSSVTLIESGLAGQLEASGEREPLEMSWTNGMSTTEDQSMKLYLEIAGLGMEDRLNLIDARTVKKLDLPKQQLEFTNIASQYTHLHGIDIKGYGMSAPKVLLGINNVHLIAPLDSRVGKPGEPVAIKCKLGWTLYGPRPGVVATVHFIGHHRCNCVECGKSDRNMNAALKEYFQLEDVGITPIRLESKEDRRAREILERTTRRVGERFESGLLWIEDDVEFPESYQMALKRSLSLDKRIARCPEIRENILKQLEEYVTKGYAHIITDQELLETPKEKTWYLPLNFVINPKKPGKVRLVWDAAARANGVSLNDKLLKGPDMTSSLPAVINAFRERPIAFGGDIKEMFHQIRVRREDRQTQRFLFNVNSNDKPTIFVMDVVIFGASCSPCISQFVKNLNAQEHKFTYPAASQAIVHKHFVDDYFDSADTIEEAIQRALEVKKVHAAGGFETRNWVSNSDEVLQMLDVIPCETGDFIQVNKSSEVERVLGIRWDSKGDKFVFSTDMRSDLEPYMLGEAWPTKRIALRCIMSLFDPKQFLAPLLIHGRILMQDVWRSGIGWDDKLSETNYQGWVRWIKLFPLIESVSIPRCYLGQFGSTAYQSVELHVFTDAGEDAYGCVAFFRFVMDTKVHCSFVEAKAKVSPLQHLSIPRKELQSATLGARLAKSISETHSFRINKTILWTDSKAVYSWVRSERRKYKEFVAHRVGQILAVSNPEDWRWVPSKQNAADDLTKWGKTTEICSESRWFRGPDFLYLSEEYWPAQNQTTIDVEEEFRAHILFHHVKLPDGLRVEHISKWNVLVRMVATMYRFISNMKRHAKKQPIEPLFENTTLPVVPLRQEEYLMAENCLWRLAQYDEYIDEVTILTQNQSSPKELHKSIERTSKLYNKSPVLDEFGVIRMEGRTMRAEFSSFDSRYPIILPGKHIVTRKLVENYHQRCGHGSRETVVNEIRQRFCVENLRALVKKVTQDCTWCRMQKAKPCVPRMAALPKQRMAIGAEPFSYVGLDYFGPLEVSVGRRREKRWVALFTCMTTRAVHLEVAYNLTTESCKMAIRRFVKRRRSPIEIFTDNGTNFVGANRELQSQIKKINNLCADTFTSGKTRWTFNPPSAPHMGGVWERMVRSVKEALKIFVDGTRLSDEILLTALIEAEDLINSRPLTYVSTNLNEDPEALTPNHFLKGISAECLPPRNEIENADALRSRYSRAQLLADEMWSRWQREYLPTLNKRSKWYGETRNLNPGDLVFALEDNQRQRGIVVDVLTGKDGRTRTAVVRTSKGTKMRPVAKLAVLEMDSSKPDRDSNSS